METQLSTAPRELAAPATPSTAQLLAVVVSNKEINAGTIDVMERLVALKEREDAKESERAFVRSFVKLQANIARIFASKKADRYSYAPFEEIMTKARPTLDECGFAIRFNTKLSEDGKIVTAFCTLMHEGGHSETNEFSVRIGTKAPGLSEPQIDGVAGTFARRYALCHALNVVVETDTDGRNQGAKITREQITELRALISELGRQEAGLLAFAKVQRMEDLTDQSFEVIKTMLEAGRKKKPAASDLHPSDQNF